MKYSDAAWAVGEIARINKDLEKLERVYSYVVRTSPWTESNWTVKIIGEHGSGEIDVPVAFVRDGLKLYKDSLLNRRANYMDRFDKEEE